MGHGAPGSVASPRMASTRKMPPGWVPLAPEVARAFMVRLVRGMRARDHLRAAVRELANEPSFDDARAAARLIVEALEMPEGGAAKAVRDFAKLLPTTPRRETRTQKIDRLRAALRAALEGPNGDTMREEIRRLAPWWIAAEVVDAWQASTTRGSLQIDEGLPLRFLAHVALRVPKRPAPLVALAHATLARHAFGAVPEELDVRWDVEIAHLRDALGHAWIAARETKTISSAGVAWFLDRAVEAMGDEPRKATAAERKRRSRARRRPSKV